MSMSKIITIYLDVSAPGPVCEVFGGLDLTLCAPLKLPVLNLLVSSARLSKKIIKSQIFSQKTIIPCENGCPGTGSATVRSTVASDFQSEGKSSLDLLHCVFGGLSERTFICHVSYDDMYNCPSYLFVPAAWRIVLIDHLGFGLSVPFQFSVLNFYFSPSGLEKK